MGAGRALLLSMVVLGCGPDVGVDPGVSSTSTSVDASTSVIPETTVSPSTTASASTSTTSGASDTSTSEDDGSSSASTGRFFIQDPDGGCTSLQCDVWAQDCPRGEKCVAWSGGGDGTFSGCSQSRCSELAAEPRTVGETCIAEGGPWSGIDDCELGTYCWNVDARTHEGVCVANCSGSEANPDCADPALSCFILANSSVIACVPDCDPLAPACDAASVCAVSTGSTNGALCISRTLAVPTGAGTECTPELGCGDGHGCVEATQLAACTHEWCCAELCDLAAPSCADETLVCTPVDGSPAGICLHAGA